MTPKIYDGTKAAQLTGATLNGVLGSDAVSLGNDTSGTFSDKNVGTGKSVTSAMTISNTDAANYTLTPADAIRRYRVQEPYRRGRRRRQILRRDHQR